MKLKYEFTVRQIAGEYVLVPMGKDALAFAGMITTNEVGALILQCLEKPTTREKILATICEEFEVDAATAEADMDRFLHQLRKNNLLQA